MMKGFQDILDMKRRHAGEEDGCAVRINILVDPLGPRSQNSSVRYRPFDLVVLCGPLIEGSSSVGSGPQTTHVSKWFILTRLGLV